MFGNIRSKGRPLRFAFLIKPNDKKALLKAIELNSILWGGAYNPIIPLFTRKTKRWRKDTYRKTAKDITLGYLRAFDPDFFVCDFEAPGYIKDLEIQVLNSSQLLPTKEEPYRLSYGVGIWSLLDWMYQEDFRYVQKFPLHLVVPKIPKRTAAFWASWFGKLPDKFEQDLLSSVYTEAMDIKTPKATELKKILNSKTIFPRRIVQYGLETYHRGGFSRENIVFYLDPTDFIDVIDFWNLRAAGRAVLPIPESLKDNVELQSIAQKYIEHSQGVHRYNSAIKYRANIIPSSSKTMDDIKKFVDSLKLKKDEDGSNPVLMQHWYPRIWDDWARGKDSIDPHDVYFDTETDLDIKDDQGKVTLPISKPEAIEDFYLGNPKIANEITFSVYSGIDKYAEVFPKSYGKEVARSLDAVAGFGDWRIGRNGLVQLIDSFRSSTWELPLAENIFSSWLADNDLVYEVSTAGRLAKELYKQIKGWTHGFANKELLDLFESMARSIDGEGRDKPIGFVKSKVKEITGSEKRMEKYLEMNLFSIGVNTKCPNCQRSSWFEVEKLRKDMACPKCLSSFKAIDSLGDSNWSFKTVGPLSVPHHADGAISVIFAINFFSSRTMHSVETTPVYSFNAHRKGSKRKMEADFAFLWRESAWGEVAEGLAFGESKTFNEFKSRDFQRMRSIAKAFPGSVLIFSTLRNDLTDFEVKELKKLTKSGNKYWKSDRPLNPVLILTGNELMSQFPPPYSWSEQDKKKFRHISGVLGLAKATQQKYLGIKAWDQVWHEEFEKKRKRLSKKKVSKKQK